MVLEGKNMLHSVLVAAAAVGLPRYCLPYLDLLLVFNFQEAS
jgi:hypothetical protein